MVMAKEQGPYYICSGCKDDKEGIDGKGLNPGVPAEMTGWCDFNGQPLNCNPNFDLEEATAYAQEKNPPRPVPVKQKTWYVCSEGGHSTTDHHTMNPVSVWKCGFPGSMTAPPCGKIYVGENAQERAGKCCDALVPV